MKEYVFTFHVHQIMALALLAMAVIIVTYLIGLKHGTE